MNILSSKTSRVVVPVALLSLFFLALIWVSYFRQRAFDKNDSIRFAIERNSNLAVALEQYTIRTLHSADAVLQVVKMEYAAQGTSLDLNQLLKKLAINQEIDDRVSIIGKDGLLKISNGDHPGDTIPDLSAKAYFIFHARHNIDSLLISPPEPSFLDSKPVFVLSRRINDQMGRFAGVVCLQVPPFAFTRFYAQAQLLPNDIISLIAPDGITYARRTGNLESAGENIYRSPLFTHIQHNPDSFYFAPDAIKNIPTWFSYRRLHDFAIIATVGSSESDILVNFYKRQPKYIFPRIMISLLIVLLSFSIASFLIHRRKLSERLVAEKEKYQRLLTEQVIAVQEREREWIGRELHDNVSQVLTTVKLYLELAAKENHHPLIPQSMHLINDSITEIRNLSHQLSAPPLGTRSLIDSIQALVETMTITNKLDITFDHSGYTSVVMSQKLALYRMEQEQINNIVKHAEATRVWITLSNRDGKVILTVKDNGKGFERKNKRNGMGINNIISRAQVFDGQVHLKTAPQKGCALTVILPVKEEFPEVNHH
jgi:signal transduction histidine kinase